MDSTSGPSGARLHAVDFDPFANPFQTVPATPAQREVWLSAQTDDDANVSFNQALQIRFHGAVQLEALTRALQRVIERHDALRGAFTKDGQEFCIAEELTVVVPVVDLADLEVDKQDRVLEARAADEASRPFDLVKGPLLRATLVRMAEDDAVLFLTLHHLVCDGWSSGVVLRDLGACYVAETAGTTPALPTPESFCAYAARQADRDDPTKTDALSYWTSVFADHVPVLDLPADRPRPPLRTFAAHQVRHDLDLGLVADLRRVNAKAGCTLFTTLLGAFEVLLHRLTGAEDLVVGIPAAAQPTDGTLNLVGHCVNLLPHRSRLDATEGFLAHARRLQRVLLEGYEHQALTFGDLVEHLPIPRDGSRIPLVSVAFNIDGEPEEGVFGPLDATVTTIPRCAENFELHLNAVVGPKGCRLECTFNRDLHDERTIQHRLRSLESLLQHIVEAPDLPISQLRVVPTTEWAPLMQTVPVRATPEAGATLAHRFADQVARTPMAIALTEEGTSYRYMDLDQRANGLAWRLRSLGVGPEAIVAIYLERSSEAVMAILAVLKAGGAYLPIDTAYPPERVRFMLDDSDAAAIVTHESLREHIGGADDRILVVDALRDGPREDAPPLEATDASLAYVIYTSGSTGMPKGVLVTHRNVTRLFDATAEWFQFSAADVWTLFHSTAFDFSVWEMWGALLHGGRLVIVPYLVSRSPEAFLKTLETEGVTVLNQTPSAFAQLVAADAEAGHPDLALRWVIFGGEALDFGSLGPWLERRGDSSPQLVNMYGITETTVHVTYRPIRLDDAHTASGSFIGTPIPDLRLLVLDHAQQPVPPGVPGELYVGGAGLARGYLRRDALTDERFLADPFVPGERLYRTGDLARRTIDGEIEYLGRIDRQVQLRGFRVELGEVEAALIRIPGIDRAAALVWAKDPGDQRLVAYVVVDGTERRSPAAIRRALRDFLPQYMVPGHVVELERMPLTPHGKVDYGALPNPFRGKAEDVATSSPPQTPMEQVLHDVWQELLPGTAIGRDDNFFEIGGHSLLSLRAVAALERRTGRRLDPRAFFFQNLSQLATVLESDHSAT